MQIFQWLFKAAEQGVQNYTTSKDQEDKPEDLVTYKKNNNNRRSKSKKFKPIIFLGSKAVSKVHSQAIMKMKKEGSVVVSHKSDSSRVSPLSEAQVAVSSWTNAHDRRHQCSSNGKKDRWPKTMSRMKELLRWAAASAKSENVGGKLSKKVDGGRLSMSESPKISFRWDAEGRCSVSSAASGIPMTYSSSRNEEASNVVWLNSTVIHGLNGCSGRRGNWITTDSEYVVLEL